MLALATALKDTSRLRRGETNSPAAAPSFSCAAPCPSSYRSSRSCPRPASSSGSSVTSPCRSESGEVPKQRNITLQGEQQGLLTELTARDDFRDSQQDIFFLGCTQLAVADGEAGLLLLRVRQSAVRGAAPPMVP